MSSAERLIEVMDLFTPSRPTWTPPEAAQALKTSRASAYRYFQLLTEAGYLEEVPGHRYALGPRLVEFDRQIRLADPLVQVAVDEMVGLAAQTGGTALLCRLYKDKVLCIHQERGARVPGFVSYERGRAMPLYRGATSKAILAFLPEARLQSLLPRNDGALRKLLERIREKRVCVTYGEVDPAACGVAVPLSEHSRVIGSLSVVLPAAEAKGRLLKSAMRLVAGSARRIEVELERGASRARARTPKQGVGR
jgi:DNA-binding IclR family transcriptional regulator